MAKIDKKYHSLLRTILNKGTWYEDPNREGVKRLQIPKYDFKHNMAKGFPAITTKKLAWNSVVTELIWFLRGDTNIKYLVDNGVNIWNKDAYKYYVKNHNTIPTSYDKWLSALKNSEAGENLGNLGKVYGAQWRKWFKYDDWDDNKGWLEGERVDQISNLIKNLKEKPLATDHIVTAWNPAELDAMALPPCHFGFQIMVAPLSISEQELFIKDSSKKGWAINHNRSKYKFDLIWDQRSVDTFLGLPFNIASYALLMKIVGHMTNMIPNMLYGSLRNVHLYENSIESAKKQLSRDVDKYKKCNLTYSGGFADACGKFRLEDNTLDEFINVLEPSMFKLKGYKSYPALKVEMLERK